MEPNHLPTPLGPPEAGQQQEPPSPWKLISEGADFQALLRSKKRFIVSGTLFFLVYYFSLPILSGYWPELMGQKVVGRFSLAYVFALSQFPMAWILAAAYLKAAAQFDRDAAAIIARHIPRRNPQSPEAGSK